MDSFIHKLIQDQNVDVLFEAARKTLEQRSATDPEARRDLSLLISGRLPEDRMLAWCHDQIKPVCEALPFKGQSDEDRAASGLSLKAQKSLWRYLSNNINQVITDPGSGLKFDDWSLNSFNAVFLDNFSMVWTQLCKKHAEIAMNPDEDNPCSSDSTCGVKGCHKEAETYFDFDPAPPTESVNEALPFQGQPEEDKEEFDKKFGIHVGDKVITSLDGKPVHGVVLQLGGDEGDGPEWDDAIWVEVGDRVLYRRIDDIVKLDETKVNEALPFQGASEEDKDEAQRKLDAQEAERKAREARKMANWKMALTKSAEVLEGLGFAIDPDSRQALSLALQAIEAGYYPYHNSVTGEDPEGRRLSLWIVPAPRSDIRQLKTYALYPYPESDGGSSYRWDPETKERVNRPEQIRVSSAKTVPIIVREIQRRFMPAYYKFWELAKKDKEAKDQAHLAGRQILAQLKGESLTDYEAERGEIRVSSKKSDAYGSVEVAYGGRTVTMKFSSLTPDQAVRIMKIVNEKQPKVDESVEEGELNLEDVTPEQAEEIFKILDAEPVEESIMEALPFQGLTPEDIKARENSPVFYLQKRIVEEFDGIAWGRTIEPSDQEKIRIRGPQPVTYSMPRYNSMFVVSLFQDRIWAPSREEINKKIRKIEKEVEKKFNTYVHIRFDGEWAGFRDDEDDVEESKVQEALPFKGQSDEDKKAGEKALYQRMIKSPRVRQFVTFTKDVKEVLKVDLSRQLKSMIINQLSNPSGPNEVGFCNAAEKLITKAGYYVYNSDTRFEVYYQETIDDAILDEEDAASGSKSLSMEPEDADPILMMDFEYSDEEDEEGE